MRYAGVFIHFFLFGLSFLAQAQTDTSRLQPIKLYYSFEDSLNKKIKASFFVLEDNPAVLEGSYVSFYESGQMKSEGQYTDSKPTGEWIFYFENGNPHMKGLYEKKDSVYWYYYYEKGNLKNEGVIQNNVKQGVWKYYYENGQLKAEGYYSKNIKDQTWKHYYEDGTLKANAIYSDGRGSYTEYYPSGKIKVTGPTFNNVGEGVWTYYHKNGNIEAKGYESNGVKNGVWSYYYTNGQIKSKGNYVNGKQNGEWQNFHENGSLSSSGNQTFGFRDGKWSFYYDNGAYKGEGVFEDGTGYYKEYYEKGNLKVEGAVKNDKNDGLWKYYSEEGSLEGECEYEDGFGEYVGYYENGNPKIRGTIENGEKTGIWKLYDEKGNITGYYKTYNETSNEPLFDGSNDSVYDLKDTVLTQKPDTALVNNTIPQDSLDADSVKKKKKYDYSVLPSYNYKAKKKSKIRNFNPKFNEYRNFIISINPLGLVNSRLPIYIEYYIQERLGFNFQQAYINDPFFSNHNKASYEDITLSGFSFSVSERLYRRNRDYGMLYGAFGLQYNNLKYTAKPLPAQQEAPNDSKLNLTNHEMELLFYFGDRIVNRPDRRGPTFDVYLATGIGYRFQDTDFNTSSSYYDSLFSDIDKKGVYLPIHVGLSFGYLF